MQSMGIWKVAGSVACRELTILRGLLVLSLFISYSVWAAEGVSLIPPVSSDRGTRAIAISACLLSARSAESPIFKPELAGRIQHVKTQLIEKEKSKEIRVVGFVRNGKPLVDEDLVPRSDQLPDDLSEAASSMDYVACLVAVGFRWPGQKMAPISLETRREGSPDVVSGKSPDLLPNEQWFGAAASTDGQQVLVVGCNGTMLMSANGGDSWVVKKQSDLGKFGCFSAVSFADNDKTIVLGGGFNGFFFSTDGGKTWKPSKVDLKGKFEGPQNIRQIVFDRDGRNGWALTSLNNGRAYRTPDGGRTWEIFHEGTRSESLVSIWMDPTGEKAWIGGAIGAGYWGPSFLTRTTDGGVSWKRTKLEGKGFIVGLAFDEAGDVGQAIGADGSVYRTKNGGEVWTVEKPPVLDKSNGWTGAFSGGKDVIGCAVGDGAVIWVDGEWRRTLKSTMRFEGVGASLDHRSVIAVGYNQIYFSKDSCQSWRQIKTLSSLER